MHRSLVLFSLTVCFSLVVSAQLPIELKQTVIPPSALRAPGAAQGTSVAIEGNVAVVGAPDDTLGGTGRGVVKVYDSTTGQLLHLIPSPEPGVNRAFGRSVAISGSRVAVGAYGTTVNGLSSVGRAYVYDLASTTPTKPIAVLDKPNPAESDLFGTCVAISGTKVVVGAYLYLDSTAGSYAGRAYVFDLTRDNPGTAVLTLRKPNAVAEDFFGNALAIDGSFVGVGAAGDDTGATNSGSVYVYDLNSPNPGTPIAHLVNPSPASAAAYGAGVSVSGTRIAVGASGKMVGGFSAGGVYLYDLAGTSPAVPVWSADNPTPANGDSFARLHLEGNRLLVGAPNDDTGATDAGAAYVYDLMLPGSQTPLTLTNPTPANADIFGVSIGLSGNRAIVGAYQDDTVATNAGSAYIYELTGASPQTPTCVLNHTGPIFNTKFGRQIATSGKWLAVAGYQEEGSTYRPGIVHVFDQSSSTPYVPVLSLQHPSPEFEDGYGSELAISGSLLAVGSPLHGPNSGTVHVYDLAAAKPAVPLATLLNPTPSNNDYFGSAVALEGTRLIVGAYLNGNTTRKYGSIYVYELGSATPTVPQLTIDNPITTSGSGFGSAVALSGNRILVGVSADNTGFTAAGRAYLYDLASPTPTVPALIIENPDPNPDAHFGSVVRLANDRAVISATANDTGAPRAGAVYVYDLARATPGQPVATLHNPVPKDSDYFGLTALSGSILAVASNSYINFAQYSGVVRFYDLDSPNPSQPIKSLPRPPLVGSGFYVGCLSLEGNRLYIGLPLNNDQSQDRGAVLIFGPDSVPPQQGTFSVSSSAPPSPTTVLTATFQGWSDESLPLKYAVMLGNSAIAPAGVSPTPTFSLPSGTHTVYGRVTDTAGNFRDTEAITVTVDGAAPLITVPANLIVEAKGPAGAVVNYAVSATDDLDPNPLVTVIPASGSGFAIGTTKVDVTATDRAGNSNATSFTVTVQDTTPPTIGGAFSPLVIVAGPLPDYTAQAITDDLVGVVSITQSPLPGSETMAGNTEVTLTATDTAQNSSTVKVLVAVKPVNPIASIAAASGQPVHASAGLPPGAVWRGFGIPAVNEAGDIAFLGRWASRASRGEGIWVQRAESGLLEPIIKRGTTVSGAANLSLPSVAQVGALQDPIIATNGDVLVPIGLMGPGLNAARGSAVLWSPASDRASARVILHVGQQLPDANDTRLAAIKGLALDSGGVAFHVRLKRGSGVPSVTSADDAVFGVWDEAHGTRVLARTGQPFGNSTLISFAVPLITPSAPGHDRAWANLEPGVPPRIGLLGKLADGSQVLFRTEAGAGDLLLVQTQPSKAVLPAGGDAFAKLRVPAWSGRVDTAAFAGTLHTGGQGIFLAGTEGIESIHRSGTEVDPGVFVRTVQDPITAPDGTLTAWQGTLRGRGVRRDSDDALFLWKEGSDASVFAREGNPAADCPPRAVYNAFQSAALNLQGLIFRGQLRVERGITGANDECLWAQSFTGQTRLILREGQAIDDTILLGFNVLNATPGTLGARRAYSDSGWLVALGSLPRGQTAILKVRLP